MSWIENHSTFITVIVLVIGQFLSHVVQTVIMGEKLKALIEQLKAFELNLARMELSLNDVVKGQIVKAAAETAAKTAADAEEADLPTRTVKP